MRLIRLALAVVLGLASIASAQPKNDLMYEVFVRSFASSQQNAVGDLKGLRAKLDYLSDLNVGIIWLMPIFPTRSYHGYDVTDYRAINPEYGTLADFDALIVDAHARGIRLIIDIPFNHSSREHPWFLDAIENRNGKRDWYIIKPDDGQREPHWRTTIDSQGNRLKYFGLFSPNMPDLNLDNPQVRAEVKAIAKFWIDRGVDGFRLDAAKHLYGWNFEPGNDFIDQNNTYWREFSDFVYAIKPDAILMGEVLGKEDALVRHAGGLNLLVDEPFMHAARKQITTPIAGFLEQYKLFLQRGEDANPNQPFDAFAYLASHDENPRLMSFLEDKVRAEEVEPRHRLGLCVLMSISARPLIYQGDEIMQRGWKWNGNPTTAPTNPGDGSGIYDETLREPLPWFAANSGAHQTRWQPRNRPDFLPHYDKPNDGISVEEQTSDPNSMLNLFRALSRLRKSHPTFANAKLGRIISDSAEWMVFERGSDSERYVVLINLTSRGMDYRFSDAWYPEHRAAQLLFWSDGMARKWKNVTSDNTRIDGSVFVPAFGMVVLKAQ
jgi:alpha-amylase